MTRFETSSSPATRCRAVVRESTRRSRRAILTDCGPDAYCAGSWCAPRLCAVNQTSCVAEVYSVCDDRGAAFTATRDCAAEGLACTLRGCQALAYDDAGIADGGSVEQADSGVRDAATGADGG